MKTHIFCVICVTKAVQVFNVVFCCSNIFLKGGNDVTVIEMVPPPPLLFLLQLFIM